MTAYCLGFAFDADMDNVILIEKLKPEFQKGKLNGIGGKIELGETSVDAMVREFKEETGIDTTTCAWHKYCILRGTWGEIHIFRTVLHERFDTFKSMEEEVVGSYWVPYILGYTIGSVGVPKLLPNNYWLIPMAESTLEQFVILETTL